jgi:hypothetical protein
MKKLLGFKGLRSMNFMAASWFNGALSTTTAIY